MGHHALRQRAHYRRRSGRQEFCQRCKQGRLVVVPSGCAPFDSGPGSGWLQVPSGVRRRELRRVSSLLDNGLAAAYAKEVLAKNFNVPPSTFDKVPKKEL